MKIAIVGSEEKHWTQTQREKVVSQIIDLFWGHSYNEYFKDHPASKDVMLDHPYKVSLISGGCPYGGVDIWAEVVADVLGIPKDIKHPEIRSWEDAKYEDSPVPLDRPPRIGYRDRNILIAEECDVLYCFDPANRGWSGGVWTHNYAERLGKKTCFIAV